MAKQKKDTQKVLNKLLDRIVAAENYRDAGYADIWQVAYQRYRNRVEEITDPDTGAISSQSNISIPYGVLQVETIKPRLIETIFASRPYVAVQGREPNDTGNAQKMEVLLDWQMNERMDITSLFGAGITGLLVNGTAITYNGWKWETHTKIAKQLLPTKHPVTGEVMTQEQPVIDPESGLPTGETEQVEVKTWQKTEVNEIEADDPEIKFLNLMNYYVDPNATDLTDARFCGHDEYLPKSKIQEWSDNGIIGKVDWTKVMRDKATDQGRNWNTSAAGLPTASDVADSNDDDAIVQVTHYWEDNRHAIILNRTYLAGDGENPFWHKRKPYCRACYIQVPDEFFGMGIFELVGDLIDELNAERNMRIDMRKFLLRRMWKVKVGSTAWNEGITWEQGGMIPIDSTGEMSDVQEVTMQDSQSMMSENEEANIKNDIRDLTGAQNVVMGTGMGSTTATEAMTLDNNASMRFKLLVSHIEKELLVGAARQIIQLDQQFLDSAKILRVTGEGEGQWEQIQPSEIQGEFDLIAAGSSVEPLANKEAFKQRMTELFTIASKDPMFTQFPAYRRELLKRVFEAYDIKDADKLLPSDQELAQFDQFQQFQAQQQAQAEMLAKSGGNPVPQGQPNTSMQQEFNPAMMGGNTLG